MVYNCTFLLIIFLCSALSKIIQEIKISLVIRNDFETFQFK